MGLFNTWTPAMSLTFPAIHLHHHGDKRSQPLATDSSSVSTVQNFSPGENMLITAHCSNMGIECGQSSDFNYSAVESRWGDNSASC